jgi:hypothetical protein
MDSKLDRQDYGTYTQGAAIYAEVMTTANTGRQCTRGVDHPASLRNPGSNLKHITFCTNALFASKRPLFILNTQIQPNLRQRSYLYSLMQLAQQLTTRLHN